MEVLLEAVFSMWSAPRLYDSTEFSSVSELGDCCGSVVVNCCCEKLVAETLTSPTSGGRSVGIVRLRTTVMEFKFFS
jgi:hypothetical protein